MERSFVRSLSGSKKARLKAPQAYTRPAIQIQKVFTIPVLPVGWAATGTNAAADVRLPIQFLSSDLQRLPSTACNNQSLENRCLELRK